MTAKRLPLEGVRVVDLSAVWAGPYATHLLADLGAEVIKVESAAHPDLLRSLTFGDDGAPRQWNRSAYFNHNNRNKLGVSLDLSHPRGRDLVLRLVEKSDLVVENFRADVMDNLGLGYPALRAANEQIILISMPGHGKDGPDADRVAYGTNIEQMSGLTSITGYIDGPPHKSGISYGDPIAGVMAAGAAIMALLARKRTGRGQYVEVSQREALTGLIGEQLLGYSIDGRLPQPMGNRHPIYAPHGCFPTRGDDQWITIVCRHDAEFAVLARLMGRDDLAGDPHYALASERHAHSDELEAEISAWTRDRERTEVFHLLVGAGIPAAPVLRSPDLAVDPQLRARGFFEPVSHREAGTWEMERALVRFAGRPTPIRMSAPCFAEHNDYVLRDILGLSADEIAGLEAERVTSREPDMSSHR